MRMRSCPVGINPRACACIMDCCHVEWLDQAPRYPASGHAVPVLPANESYSTSRSHDRCWYNRIARVVHGRFFVPVLPRKGLLKPYLVRQRLNLTMECAGITGATHLLRFFQGPFLPWSMLVHCRFLKMSKVGSCTSSPHS